MAMVCPKCNGTFEQRLNCPQCDVRLLYQAGRGPGLVGEAGTWQQTPWGRLIVGLIVSQGLYYGLRHLVTAFLLAGTEATAREFWGSLNGLILLQGLQAVGALLAGVVAGAGQRKAFVYGAMLGLWGGVLDLMVQTALGKGLTSVVTLGLPMIQATFGALGGIIGSSVWRPLPSVSMPTEVSPFSPRKATPRRRTNYFAGPVAWVRVGLGVLVAIAGAMGAHILLELIVLSTEGNLQPDSKLQAELVTWEITALVIFIGGACGGAGTRNPIKQGLCVGLGAATVLLGAHLSRPVLPIPVLLFSLATAMGLSLIGGWFGGELFPPILVPRGRKRARLGAPGGGG